jgi:hypothetical protein
VGDFFRAGSAVVEHGQYASVQSVGGAAYAERMQSLPAPHVEELPPLPRSGASPAEIRAALHPEYREEFDRDYRAALDEAGRSLDLTELHAVVESWRRRCCVTRDRGRYRQMMRDASTLLTDEKPPEAEPLSVTETRVFTQT